jgi:hypothetical protein
MSFYFFAEAMLPLLAALLLVGIWARGRQLIRNWGECLTAAIFALYFCGFALFNTGPRFMTHLFPLALGVAALGYLRLVEGPRIAMRWGGAMRWVLPLLLAMTLLPRALMPIGYDLKPLREAAVSLNSVKQPIKVVAADPRAAYYAHGIFVDMTLLEPGALCRIRGPVFLIASASDQRRYLDSKARECLEPKGRYERPGGGYYELFVVIAK